MNKVFVYGTLKSNHGNNGLLRRGGAEPLGKALTATDEYDMYRPTGFPYVLMEGTHTISGELYEVDDQCMRSLDGLEGYPNHYDRKEVGVLYNNADSITKAWIYVAPKAVADRIKDSMSLIVPDNNIQDWG